MGDIGAAGRGVAAGKGLIVDEYDIEEGPCPKCGHHELRSRSCVVIGCDDGWIDLYEEDPLWFGPGDTEPCQECKATGIVRWCPNCGADLSGVVLGEGPPGEM